MSIPNTQIILIVEDDAALRKLAQKQMSLFGYESRALESGEEAVEYDRSNVCLIFMDIGLPGMNGIETAVLIRKQEQSKGKNRVPIVALTAHSNRDECLAAGMDDFLQKPARLSDIKQMIDRWAKKNRSVAL